MVIAIAAALAAGASFALAGVLQQRAASLEPSEVNMSLRLLRSLVRQPMWLAGIACAFLAYVFQAVALAFGPLSLVQPLIVSEMVFAIPLSVRLYGVRLHAREWCGVLAVAGGLVTALAAARPHQDTTRAPLSEWVLALVALTAATGLALLGSRRARGPARASLTALAGGIVMGSQSVFLNATIEQFREGVLTVFLSWQTYLLVAASLGGLLLIQSAFQEGPLSASMPVFDASEPTVAVTMGVLLFDETLRTGPLAVGFTIAGVLLLLTGIVLLDTSPTLAALHRQVEEERPDAGAPRPHRSRPPCVFRRGCRGGVRQGRGA